jgi:hypothetical protein
MRRELIDGFTPFTLIGLGRPVAEAAAKDGWQITAQADLCV